MFKAAVLAVIVLFITKAISFEGAKKHIHFNVLIMIASAIGIGIALDKTGAAAWLAQSFVRVTHGLGIIGMLACVYLVTTFFTEIVTNNAAAVLMFPISQAIAQQAGADRYHNHRRLSKLRHSYRLSNQSDCLRTGRLSLFRLSKSRDSAKPALHAHHCIDCFLALAIATELLTSE
ncbi:SLC13 family permease [Ammoniphilus sp. 3BR4]|uniref:SLC13 family permease n=1 Tax=Ammoniphilus sp. 3BR4 TaxID=3158265 RepID=UPI0034660CB7